MVLKFSVALFNFRLILVVYKDLHERGNSRRINLNFRGIKEALNLLFSRCSFSIFDFFECSFRSNILITHSCLCQDSF